MGLARQEAMRFNHDYIGTEHILLGIISEGSGVAASVIKNLDIDLNKVRTQVDMLVSAGSTVIHKGQIPYTPRSKKVLEHALEEASNLGHTYIGTEHLLLGLIRENEGIAAQALRRLRIKIEDVRDEILELLGAEPAPAEEEPPQHIKFKVDVKAFQKAAPAIDNEYLNQLTGAGSFEEQARQRLVKNLATPLAAEVIQEIIKATAVHGKFQSAHEGWAVIYEELDELWDEVRAKKHDRKKMRKECIQVAAMAFRFMMDLCEDE